MFAFKLNYVLFLFIFNGCYCQRRIKDGVVGGAEKKYMVYLLKASISPRYYDAWMCGGSLVSPEFIVTSAACVSDVIHLYAIAGYNKYVSDAEVNTDPCTKEKKKKVILVCTPKAYELQYEQIEKWSYIDIAVVKVESPYDFTDTSYETVCSYTPQPIIINYELKYQEPGVDAIVFGWGHLSKWREQLDPTDYNQEKLNYAPTLIQDKEECKKEYEVYTGMDEIIDKYMICTFDKGNINDEGETIIKADPTAQGCTVHKKKALGYEGVSCESANSPGEEIVLIDNSRKDLTPANLTNHTSNNADQIRQFLLDNARKDLKPTNRTSNKNADQIREYLNDDIYSNVVDSNITHNSSLIDKMYKSVLNSRRLRTRRHGICQNDHGGPLVTWVGSHEVLIGVASVFKITEDLSCVGPYLFTSTQCNGAFLDCILRSDPDKTETTRREICSNLHNQGFKLVEKYISWKDHPDGPADNERNQTSTTNTTQFHFKEERNKKHYNATNLVNTNNTKSITDTTTTKLSLNTTGPINNVIPTRTTRAVNIVTSTTINLTNATSTNLTNITSANLTNTAPTILTSATTKNLIKTTSKNVNATSTNLLNTTFTNLTNLTSSSFENAAPTLVFRATSTNVINATSTNLTDATSINILNTTFTIFTNIASTAFKKAAPIKFRATSTNLDNATTINVYNATFKNVTNNDSENKITTILTTATNAFNTTTTKQTPQQLVTSY